MSELVTDLEKIKQLAAARYDEFEVMRYQLVEDDDLTDEDIDAVVDQIAAPIIAAIDCTTCANCCRSLTVQLGMDDVEQLAAGIQQSSQEVLGQHVDLAEDDPDIVGTFRQKPCAFLQGKLCSVYEHRPEACRAYPEFTPNFRWMLEWTIPGAALCPIIYNVLDAITDAVDDLQRGVKNP